MQSNYLNDTLSELTALEPLYHAACPDANLDDFDRLVSAEFWEVGASGNTYSRQYARNALQSRPETPHQAMWQTSDFAIQQVSSSVFLLSYVLVQPMRTTKRMTVWQNVDNREWQAVYHQGTVVSDYAMPD